MAYTRTGYANFAAFPATGAANIIYVDLSNGNEYLWLNSAYVAYTGTQAGVRLGYQDAAWFAANPSFLLGKGQKVHLLQTGTYKIGDGVTLLSALSFLGGGSTPNIQAVLTAGNVATTTIETTGFIKTGGTSAQFLKADGSVDGSSYLTGLVVGTTTITSGTNTRILYNNAGVVGEYTFQTVHKGMLVSSGVCLGDSTIAAYLAQNSVDSYLLHPTDTQLGNTIASLAVAGHTILQQQTAWTADSNKATYDYIIVQVGLNDLDPTEAASIAIARYQTLINIINSGKKSTATVIVCTMTPCYNRLVTLYGGSAGTAYTKWQDMNTAIMGGGATPITGVDERVDKHTNSLNNGYGALADIYEVTGTVDGIHENNLGRDIIANCWREGLQELGFLKTHPTETMANLFQSDGTYINLVKNNGTGVLKFGSLVGTLAQGAIYINQTTPSATNYTLTGTNTITNLNAVTTLNLAIGGSPIANLTSTVFTSTLNNTFGTASGGYNHTFLTGTGVAAKLVIQGLVGTTTQSALYFGNITPSGSNYAITADGSNIVINGSGSSNLYVGGAAKVSANSTTVSISGILLVSGNSTFSGNVTCGTINSSKTITLYTTSSGDTNGFVIGSLGAGRFSAFANQGSPGATNYCVDFNTTTTNINATTTLNLAIGGTTQVAYTSLLSTYTESVNLAFGTTTGSKLGTATTQKIGFWNATPIVQPTTAVAASTLTSNGGTTLTSTDTIDGYTLLQVVKALRNTGLLA